MCRCAIAAPVDVDVMLVLLLLVLRAVTSQSRECVSSLARRVPVQSLAIAIIATHTRSGAPTLRVQRIMHDYTISIDSRDSK